MENKEETEMFYYRKDADYSNVELHHCIDTRENFVQILTKAEGKDFAIFCKRHHSA